MIDPIKLLRARKMFSFLTSLDERCIYVEIRCHFDAYYVRVLDGGEDTETVYSAQSGSIDSALDKVLEEMKREIQQKIDKQRSEIKTAESLLDG